MKRTWLRWGLMTLFVVALGFTFVQLGQWQLDRLDQRRDRNATTAEHEKAPVRPFEEVFTGTITDADQWQRVSVSGTFLADKQLQARYRSFDGKTGWELITPLRTTSVRSSSSIAASSSARQGRTSPRSSPTRPPARCS